MSETPNFIDPAWNPMKEDYENQEYNSYVEGQGRRLKGQVEFCVQVQDIPPSMSDEALLNIFSRFGKVRIQFRQLSKFGNKGCHVAYLVYDTQIAVNRACGDLDRREKEKDVDKDKYGGFDLRVKIAPPKEGKKRNDQFIFDSRFLQKNIEPEEKNQPKPDNIYEGPKFEEIKSTFFPADCPIFFITNDNFDPAFCNPFIDFLAKEYKIYPILDTVSSKLVKKSNKRVSLGRGYFVAENQNNNATVISKSIRFNEKFKNRKNERCILCDKPAFRSCPKCDSFYCGLRCQNVDWPKHKSICGAQAPKKNGCVESLSISLKVTHNGSDFMYAIKADDLERFEMLRKRMQEESPKQRRFTRPVKGSKCAVFIEDRDEWCRGIFVEISPPAHLIFFIDYGFSTRCLASSIHCLHPELSVEEPFALKLSLTGQNGFKISSGTLLKVSSLEMKKDYYKATIKDCEHGQSQSVVSSVKTTRTTDFFGKTQVKIIDLSSEEFTEVCVRAKLGAHTYFVSWKDQIMPGKCEDKNAYIVIGEEESAAVLPVGAVIRVRSLNRVASDFFIVETDADLTQLQNGVDTNNVPNSIIHWLEKNDSGKLDSHSFQRDTTFLATMAVEKNKHVEFLKSAGNDIFIKLARKCEKLPQKVNFVPKIGDYVAVNVGSSTWVRSIVWCVSQSFVRCILIDVGRVVSVPFKFVRPLESKFKACPSLVVHCKVESVNEKLKESWESCLNASENFFDFIVKETSFNRVKCVLMNKGEEMCKLEVSEWNPTAEEVGLKAVELKNNMEVQITQFYSASLLYVTPVNHANFMINQKLTKLVRSLQPIKDREPKFGELVACKWSKNNEYYRAQIFERIEKDRYRIFFVDSGTQEIGNLCDIFELDDELKSYPCLAVKICLKGIDETNIPTYEAVSYLNTLGIKNEPLKILFDNNDLSSVELRHLNNDVNEVINQCLKPADLDPHSELYDTDVIYAQLEVGAEVELGLQRKGNGALFMFEPKSDAAQFVFGTLHERINAYCENLKNNGYNPHDNEVVFAQINTRDDVKRCWCRAMVIKTVHLGSHVVQCLDFGGQADVLTTSIRKMHPMFMVVPAVGITVEPKLPADLNPAQKIRIESLFTPLEMYSGKVLSRDDFHYCIDMNFIHEILRSF